jgi:hypothetical protein
MARDKIVEKLIDLESRIINVEYILKTEMATKSDINNIMDKLDFLIGEYTTLKNERLATNSWLGRVDDTVYDHDARIKALERKRAEYANLV